MIKDLIDATLDLPYNEPADFKTLGVMIIQLANMIESDQYSYNAQISHAFLVELSSLVKRNRVGEDCGCGSSESSGSCGC